MEQIRQAMANIQRSMGGLTATHKLLFGSLAVIAAMTLFLVSQYAAKPAMVDFTSLNADSATLQALKTAGIDASVVDGKVMVPKGSEYAALSVLGESGLLPGNTEILFNNLIQSQDWKASREQHRQQAVIALQNELGRVISRFRGIRKATVILDIPEPMGLGRAVQEPSASVSVETMGGAGLSQATVDAIAGLVAGSRAGLTAARVMVVDATTGRQHQVSDEQSVSAGRYLEHQMQVERHIQREIERLLAHIQGAVVSVNAVVDVTRVASSRQQYLPKDQGTVSIANRLQSTEDSVSQASRAAEPGTRSFATADINAGAGAAGTSSTKTTEESEFTVQVGSETTSVVDPRGMPTHLSASVVIPQSFVEALVRQSRGEDKASDPVTFEEAEQFFTNLVPMLERSILTRLQTVDADGQVRSGKVELAMAPMPAGSLPGFSQAGLFGAGGAGGGGGGGGGMGGMFSASGMIETIVLGVLGLVAVVMMFSMVKRAGRKSDLPTAEELVGVTPTLDMVGDLVGEADESEAAMAGIEISEDEVQIHKMRELVGELINTNPEAAASLVGRWISEHD
jgi:flagellar biosynthesis/type III secretory pathway M-ring protein FliF/YscJ